MQDIVLKYEFIFIRERLQWLSKAISAIKQDNVIREWL